MICSIGGQRRLQDRATFQQSKMRCQNAGRNVTLASLADPNAFVLCDWSFSFVLESVADVGRLFDVVGRIPSTCPVSSEVNRLSCNSAMICLMFRVCRTSRFDGM